MKYVKYVVIVAFATLGLYGLSTSWVLQDINKDSSTITKVSAPHKVVKAPVAAPVEAPVQPAPVTTPQPAPTPKPAAPVLSSEGTSGQEQAMINSNNAYRQVNNLAALSTNYSLMISSQVKANDMCNRGYFAHVDPDGHQPWYYMAIAGYSYSGAGENLAQDFNTNDGAFNALVKSPTHHANIVGNYNEIGVGFNTCGGRNITVIHYGLR